MARMTDGDGVEDLVRRSQLPDPCTLVFGVPREAPALFDADGPQWSVAHWIHCAGGAGQAATPVEVESDEPSLTYAGKDMVDDVFFVTASEHPEGGGRCITFQIDADGADADGFDTYCLVLDPGQHTVDGGVTECDVDDRQLLIRLTEEAAQTLGQGRVLRFELARDEFELATLRYGLRRTLDAGRPDARSARLDV
jgi:hypothetical protein